MRWFIIDKLDKNSLYEYAHPIELKENAGNYIVIPSSIILNNYMNDKRTTVFSFFSVRKGLDNICEFSINSIVKWSNRKPDRHKGGINTKIMQIIEYMIDNGYLTLSDNLDNVSYTEATCHTTKVKEECKNRFAVIYLDELKQVLNYQGINPKDSYLNVDVILLVFAYLRMKIYRRRNKLMPEERNLNNKNNYDYDIEQRRLRCPEAYDCFYYEIANDLNISPRTVSKAVAALNELNLIYSEALPRIKYNDGDTIKWRTDHTIFCNVDKREGNQLLSQGEKYYLFEINNKKKKLNVS